MESASKKLDLRKEIVLDLKKNLGIRDQIAQVSFSLDFSGSMDELYRNGTVQNTLERILPIGMGFDDNEAVDLFLFSRVCRELTPLTRGNYINYVNERIWGKYDMGSTRYAPVIEHMMRKYIGFVPETPKEEKKSGGLFGGLFGGNKATSMTSAKVEITPKKITHPVYNIFMTDGDNDQDDKDRCIEMMKIASNYGIFIQFVGIGNAGFQFLDKLDNMSGRLVDNANFFRVPDLSKTTDEQLYGLMMREFPSWLNLAKSHNLIN